MTAGSCMSGHGWVPDAQGRSARAASVRGRSARRTGRFVQPGCGNRPAACAQTAPALAAQGCPSTRRADRSSNRAAWGRPSAFVARGIPCHAGDRPALAAQSTCSCYAGYSQCRAVSTRPDSPLSARPGAVRSGDRSTHLTGSLGSTQTELGPLVGGESECLGGVGQ